MNAHPFAGYMICTSPRSGSTLLCKLLAATGLCGEPNSHFHTPDLARWLEDYGLRRGDYINETEALRAVVAAALARGRGGQTGETALFGLRMQRGSFAYFSAQISKLTPKLHSDRARLRALFGPMLYIHLTRANKLDQAISLSIARQSGLWHRAPDGREIERTAAHTEPRYDHAAIRRHMRELEDYEAEWLAWFRTEKITPLTITYDTLSKEPAATLARVLAALGKDPRAARVPLPTAKLATKRNRDWARRYRAETSPS